MGGRGRRRTFDCGEPRMKSRREFLATSAALTALPNLLRAAGLPFRYSICNEVFEKRDFRESCKLARSMGYTGLEIAPFTLGENVKDIAPANRKELRSIMNEAGLKFAGMHWLLITPNWLHITTGDKVLRQRSWDYFRELVDFAG